MADVLTNRLRATKPDVGGSDDTWGSKLNTDWDIVDRVYRDLAGALVSTSGGSGNDHDVTLTHTDYADIDSTLGFRIALRSGASNAGDMTLDVLDGNGPRPVRKFVDGLSVVLAAGDFPIHYVGDFVYIRRSGFSGWVLTNPATGVVKPVPPASTTVVGITRYATDLEAQNETLATVAVTPKNLHSVTGTILPDASTTVKGKVELATNAEAIAGTDATRAVTPAGLEAALDDHAPNATSGQRGIVELATDAEALVGTDATKALTARNLDYVFANRGATTTEKGTVEFATGPEAIAGTLFNKAINPVTLNQVVDAAVVLRMDARLKQLGLIPE